MPSCHEELALYQAGFSRIAGVDEVGRGCWAGPVVAAAVVLPERVLAQPELLSGVDDSKLLTPGAREEAAELIRALALAVGVGAVPAYLVDCLGIVRATRLAMAQAVLCLPLVPDAMLIDALALPEIPLPQRALIHGDALSLSIAAASIVAKVARDRLMIALDCGFPGYGFASHKGYGTPRHKAALARLGPSLIHRRSFRPVLDWCGGERGDENAGSNDSEFGRTA
ncbi:MAG: ribonuclease HII [Herpetosiphonaceae bacterium]|nr:MAG: ribonuclease HII [Herpetosiphonaceae bacterium]